MARIVVLIPKMGTDLGNQIPHDLPVNISKPEIAASMPVSELLVIEAEQP